MSWREPPWPDAPQPEDFEDCRQGPDHIKHQIKDADMPEHEQALYDKIKVKADQTNPRPKLRIVK